MREHLSLAKEDMAGRVCLVTGATSGIGRVAAHSLAERGARVVIVGRSAEKTSATVAAIQQATGNLAVEGLLADLSRQSQVRSLAEQAQARCPQLDALVNNAGGVFVARQETEDGIEMTFAVNHLAHFLLTNLLLDNLQAAARAHGGARIVNVASGAHRRVPGLDFDDLQSRRRYSAFSVYSASKLANVLFTSELARRLAQAGSRVTANAMHPGLVHTGFGGNNRQWYWRLVYVFINLAGRTPAQGADTITYLATAPELAGVSGQYFYKRQAVAPSRAARDPVAAARLWEVSAQLTGLTGVADRVEAPPVLDAP
jgi:NAD(P)-dependent dehydrogenase (short-subunit alcohol dehydrogenase family)